MSSESEHTLRPGEVFGRRVKEARRMRGWTQEQLAEELDRWGYPLPRSTLAKIEAGGTRADARIGDVLALAAALKVQPVHLLTPLQDEAQLAVTSTTTVPAPLARAWFRGDATLPEPEAAGLPWAKGKPADMAESELRSIVRPLVWSRLATGADRRTLELARDQLEAETERITGQIVDEFRSRDEWRIREEE